MNTKTITIMGSLAVILISASLFIALQRETIPPQTEPFVFPGLLSTLNEVSELVVTTQTGTITMVRKSDRWAVKEKDDYPADMGKIRQTVIGLGELKILEAKTKKAELYDKLGLEEVEAEGSSSTRITLKDTKGTSLAEAIVGKQRPAKGTSSHDEVYIRKAGDAQAWLAVGTVSVENSPSEWLDKDFLKIQPERVRRVSILHHDRTALVLEKDKPNVLNFTVRNLPKGKNIRSQFVVNNIVSTVTSLELDDVKPQREIPFDETAVVTATVETFDGFEGTVTLLQKDETHYVTVSAVFKAALIWNPEPDEDSETNKQADQNGQEKEEVTKSENSSIKPEAEVKAEIEALNKKVGSWVYVIPKFRAETILKKPEDLIEQSSS